MPNTNTSSKVSEPLVRCLARVGGVAIIVELYKVIYSNISIVNRRTGRERCAITTHPAVVSMDTNGRGGGVVGRGSVGDSLANDAKGKKTDLPQFVGIPVID
jgi:hypothetical protein